MSLKDVTPWREPAVSQTTWLQDCKDLGRWQNWELVVVSAFHKQFGGLTTNHLCGDYS